MDMEVWRVLETEASEHMIPTLEMAVKSERWAKVEVAGFAEGTISKESAPTKGKGRGQEVGKEIGVEEKRIGGKEVERET